MRKLEHDAISFAKQVTEGIATAMATESVRNLAAEFLQSREVIRNLHEVCNQHETNAMVAANHDTILRMHEEAIQLVAKCIKTNQFDKIRLVLDALSLFHPMHGESWKGWPEV